MDGRKTQTRRVMKFPAGLHQPCADDNAQDLIQIFKCPYGQLSDLLWVRETFANTHHGLFYKADDETVYPTDGRWKSPRFMPRTASRLTLRITDIRVERVQDISEKDAFAEGMQPDNNMLHATFGTEKETIASFINLWVSIHGKDAWFRNDWVWVIGFERYEQEQKQVVGV